MASKVRCIGLALLTILLSGSVSAQVPDWVGTKAGYGTYARDDPLQFLAALSKMPPAQQRQYLKIVGRNMQLKQNMPCNMFGGEDSCMTLPSDSKFANVCPEHDLKVDCAYYSDDLQEVNNDPSDDLRDELVKSNLGYLEPACPECFDNQRRMWCAQTVPKCGSFQTNVEVAILPALQKATGAQDDGENQVRSLGRAVPDLLAAMALSLPCRDMCEAVVGTCACSRERKFGELLDQAVINHSEPGMELPDGFTKDLFGDIYDRPLCSLYAEADTPNFAGHCDETMPGTCTNQQAWCDAPDGGNPGPDMVQELMALQLARSIFGWMDSPSAGLFQARQELVDDADESDMTPLEDKYLRSGNGGKSGSGPSSARSGGSSVMAAILVVALLGALAGVAGVAYVRYTSGRRVRDTRSHEGYVSMVAVEDAPPTFRVPIVNGAGGNQL